MNNNKPEKNKKQNNYEFKGKSRNEKTSHYAVLIWNYEDNPKDSEL